MPSFDNIPDTVSFPDEERNILNLWDQLDAFKTSLKMSEGKPEYTFYDGPPFATGLPHYGHILAGTIKDIVTRYAHQTGHHVIRRFGWDCHGLPIEFEIDNKLGISGRDDVLKMGIDKYNAECRSIVMRYSKEWESIVKRLGRWIDFENDYKTLDPSFMESVWWVFKQLFEKDLVYRGYKVMPYSTGCTTPLSNFEANLNYKDVSDPAIIVSFPLLSDPETSLLAWTTTPWTLPSNFALCVNPELDYVKIRDKEKNKMWIVAETRICSLYKETQKDAYEILQKLKGKDMVGWEYTPLFEYFAGMRASHGAFRVLADGFVTDDSGTGVVHCAPAFGEDDFRVCQVANIVRKGESVVCPVDDAGKFTEAVPQYTGRHVKECDDDIKRELKNKGRLIHSGTIVHSYPYCWRSETPLIYKAVPSWFVKVENLKERLLANNLQSYWVPNFVQEKRFHNWLQDARDWCISRNRYWGTPLPLWVSDDYAEMVCVGSIEELERLTGQKFDDIHRDKIDHVTIPSQRGPQFGVLKRVDEVFDCWFESGSMPYGQIHYPFENQDLFQKGFPADFIAEGLDQTRGWFYTLLVISTALFDKPPFKNLIVNGLVLAADGKKMSKRLKNYPDPIDVVNEFGADAVRLYLINSPVVRAEPLKFQKAGVRDVVKDVFLPWFNAYRFLVQNVTRLELETGARFTPDVNASKKSGNVMDKWIQAVANSLIAFVREEMSKYRLYTVVPRLISFLEQLTNWYVRLNRLRLKGSVSPQDCELALATLYDVLLTVVKTMAPFTPFLTEFMYQNLKKVLPDAHPDKLDCVHYLEFPQAREDAIDPRIEEAVSRMQRVIDLARNVRERCHVSFKIPCKEVIIVNKDQGFLRDVQDLQAYVQSELNVRKVTLVEKESDFVTLRAQPDNKALGKRLGKEFAGVAKAIKELSHEQIANFEASGEITILNHKLGAGDVQVLREFKGGRANMEAAWDGSVLVVLDVSEDEELKNEGFAREVINRVQKLRKKAKLNIDDDVEVFYQVSGPVLKSVVNQFQGLIASAVRVPLLDVSQKPAQAVVLISESDEVANAKLTVTIAVTGVAFNDKSLEAKFGSHGAKFVDGVKTTLCCYDINRLRAHVSANQKSVRFELDGQNVELVHGVDFFFGAGEKDKLSA
eukprot:GILJ01003106.1.p1 GENE.GILJ01003106.1~~GILJ01003106.1.p1  ORF type:complete len:1149 (-),score=229.84 GILJ01003106.1:175-3621(-)